VASRLGAFLADPLANPSETTSGARGTTSARKRDPLAQPRFVDLACRDREHRVDRLLDIEPIGRPDAVVCFVMTS
jgi:hypothetical protein